MGSHDTTGTREFTSYLQWSDEGRADIWRYCLGAVLALFFLLVLAGVGMIPIQLLDPDFKSSLIESNVALLSGFLVPFILVPLMVQWLHKRPYWSVGLPVKRFQGGNFGIGLGVGEPCPRGH